MSKHRRFHQVDVFTSEPYGGNPVAVVLDGAGLSTEEMVRFTRWTNLSEAAFVLPTTRDGADYRVRIFTSASSTTARRGLAAELPFAGHPTLGTCHAWLESSGRASEWHFVQECAVGLVSVRRADGLLWFAAPPLIRSGAVEESLLRHIARILGIARSGIVDAAWVDNGPGWVAVLLETAEAVLALEPGFVDLDLGVVGPYPSESSASFEVRAFFPRNGVTAEDPVTGSLNAGLAQWLLGSGRIEAPYVVSQGLAVGRSGRVHVDVDGGTLWVGGKTITCIRGDVEL